MRADEMDLEKLGRMAGLPVDDPERKQFEASADNAALLLAYHRFLDAPEISGARPGDAESELRRFVAEQTEPRSEPAPPASSRFFEWLSQLMRPGVLAPAAFVVLLAVGATLWPTRQPEPPVLRDLNSADVLRLEAPEPLADGSVRVSWEPFSGVDAYAVRLLTADLEEIARIYSVPGTELIISTTTVTKLEDVRFWQVIGLQAGDELLRSSIETLR